MAEGRSQLRVSDYYMDAIAKALLGENVSRVSAITIELEPRRPVIAHVTYFVDDERMQKVITGLEAGAWIKTNETRDDPTP
jgi:hypothetical protein